MIELEKTYLIQNYIKKIVKEHEEKKKQCTEDIQEVENDIYDVLAKINDVSLKKDIVKYHDYNTQLEELEEKRHTLECKLRMLNDFPLISHFEYDVLLESVIGEIKEAEKATRVKLVLLSEEAEELGKQLQDATNKANEALVNIQKELYKERNPRVYDTFDTVLWAGAGVDARLYRIETNKRRQKIK